MTRAELEQAFHKLGTFDVKHAQECFTGFVESDAAPSYEGHETYYIEGQRKAHEDLQWFLARVWAVLDEAKVMSVGFEQGIDTVSGSGVSGRLQRAFKQLERFLEENLT